MTTVAVLRPEPGNAATCARAAAAGFTPLALPLFSVAPLGWTPPEPAAFNALLLTSANAARHAGEGLAVLRHLPVVAVGAATARAAREVGLTVVHTGAADAASAAAAFDGRLLHLAGREHVAVVPDVVAVYATEPLAIAPDALARLNDTIALLHSARGARRLDELMNERAAVRLACLSPQVAAAACGGWRAVAVATHPTDAALLEAARAIDR